MKKRATSAPRKAGLKPNEDDVEEFFAAIEHPLKKELAEAENPWIFPILKSC